MSKDKNTPDLGSPEYLGLLLKASVETSLKELKEWWDMPGEFFKALFPK